MSYIIERSLLRDCRPIKPNILRDVVITKRKMSLSNALYVTVNGN
jgi:hypothetical protein